MEFIKVTAIDPSVVLLTLNRPDKRNALNVELLHEICLAFDELQRNPKNRVVIINAEGPVFCSGLDLIEAIDPLLEDQSATLIARFLTTVYSSSLVTIAAVNGAAIGGGAGILCACDLAIAAANAKIGFPEARRGLVAAQVAVFLSRQIQMRKVRELLLLGELIDSEQALSMGLINRVVEESQLIDHALKMAEMVVKNAPHAIKETKRLLDALDPTRFSDDLDIALAFHHSARRSDEAKEGTSAFLEKRPPKWEKVTL